MIFSIIGTGDASKIKRYTNLNLDQFKTILIRLADILAKSGDSIMIIPDTGVPLELAKIYKQKGGAEVIGIVPTTDMEYGIKHIEKNLGIIDKKVEVNSWHQAAPRLIYNSDIVICLGISSGTLIDLGYVKYNLKWKPKKVQKVFVFRNMISGLPRELEEDLKPVLVYINQPEELLKYLY